MGVLAALIGFGEAGQAFAQAGGWGPFVRAYDRLTDQPETRAAKQEDYEAAGVVGVGTPAEAVGDAPLVLSLVTANEALEAARACALHISPRTLYCDLNSVAPETKRSAAAAIEGAGGRYIDGAIMAPVHPNQLAVPLLLSGRYAGVAETALSELGFTQVRIVGGSVGQASAIKMVRSVIVKGIEALTAEAILAAEAAGVTSEVLASLDSSERVEGWAQRADYNLDRMIMHGLRRAAEMEEVAKTLESLGVEPLMTRAIVQRQRQVGSLELGPPAEELAAKIDQVTGRKADAA